MRAVNLTKGSLPTPCPELRQAATLCPNKARSWYPGSCESCVLRLPGSLEEPSPVASHKDMPSTKKQQALSVQTKMHRTFIVGWLSPLPAAAACTRPFPP